MNRSNYEDTFPTTAPKPTWREDSFYVDIEVERNSKLQWILTSERRRIDAGVFLERGRQNYVVGESLTDAVVITAIIAIINLRLNESICCVILSKDGSYVAAITNNKITI